MDKPKILVVEDDLIIAQDIKNILEEEDIYEIFTNITSYNQAIEAIEKINPDLVLIDIKIKGEKDGIDLGQYLIKIDNIPFIYITSYTDSLTLERVKATRPFGLIAKPFRIIDIKASVSITLNNFSHKRLDSLRLNKELVENMPFVIRNVVNYINENIYDNIDIEDLTKLTRWKKHHFLRSFTKTIGMTPYQYILKKKIDIAKSLISETNQPINEIAFDLGFNNYGNFSIIFKKFSNSTPENFKKNIISKKENILHNYK